MAGAPPRHEVIQLTQCGESKASSRLVPDGLHTPWTDAQEPPEETRALNMRANELMTKEVVCLRPIEKVAAVMSALRDYDHNCFPVVEDREQRVLLGTVYR